MLFYNSQYLYDGNEREGRRSASYEIFLEMIDEYSIIYCESYYKICFEVVIIFTQ